MPDKTSRLEALLPDVYAARHAEGVLHRLVDAAGSQLALADRAIKGLLVSHWLDHASGGALDGLAATFGERRRRVAGGPESDEALRQRLRSLVARFRGGGTVAAVKGAVRSALGLPFDLSELPLPSTHPLVAAVDALVDLAEFSPVAAEVRQSASTVHAEGNRNRLDLVIDLPSVQPDRPVVEITVTSGVARNISLEVEGTDHGLRAAEQLAVNPGERLVLSTVLGTFDAQLVAPGGRRAVSHLFTSLSGGVPEVPLVPVGASTWIFKAGSGFTAPEAPPPPSPPLSPPGTGAGPGLGPGPAVGPGVGPGLPRPPIGGPVPGPSRRGRWSAFDVDTFDLPTFDVGVSWTLFTPLTFDVTVPYFLAETVERLQTTYGVGGPVFTHEGLPREQIQGVVDASRAAGVQGRVRFSVALPSFDEPPDRHDVRERVTITGVLTMDERADVAESLSVGSVSSIAQTHDQDETVTLGGIFNVSTFDDSPWGFAQ